MHVDAGKEGSRPGVWAAVDCGSERIEALALHADAKTYASIVPLQLGRDLALLFEAVGHIDERFFKQQSCAQAVGFFHPGTREAVDEPFGCLVDACRFKVE